jgi:Uma2 family endonuclease
MSAAALDPELISPEDYLAAETTAYCKHEYVGGVVYATPGSTTRHYRIATNALVSLGAQLRGRRCEVFNSDAKVRVRLPTHTRFYYPDLQVVCDSAPDEQTFQDEPVVIVEVISERTRRTDEWEKKDAYLSLNSLVAYILLEQKSATATVWRRHSTGFKCERWVGADAVVPLAEIGLSLPLSEAYRGVNFTPEAADEDDDESR